MRHLKRLLLYSTITTILLITLFISLFLLTFFSSTICEREFVASYIDKLNWLENSPSPRIIFVGDSNLAFTLDSELIEQAFPYTPVNMGVTINIGLRFDLEFIRPHIRDNDLIILSSTFSQFTGSTFDGNPNQNKLWGLIVLRPEYIRYLNSWQQVSNIMHNNYKQMKDRLESGTIFETSCILLHSHIFRDFNKYGDYVGHLNKESLGKDFSKKKLGNVNVDEETIYLLNEFARDVESVGANIIFMYPSYAQGMWNNSEDKLLKFHDIVGEKLNFPIIGHPSNYYLPNDLLYDGYFHGTSEGREKRTRQVISDLSQYLEDLD